MSKTEDQIWGIYFNGKCLFGWVLGRSEKPIRFTREEAKKYLARHNRSERYEIRRLPLGIETVRR